MVAAGPTEQSSDWLVLLAPLVLVAVLVGLAIYFRGGPATSHGYALKSRPRRRRRVPAWLITVLRPLFVYNHHRDAYILRGVGNRIGPVLRQRRDDAPMELPAVRRTGRFRRVEPEYDEPLEVQLPEPAAAAAPRAPIGARGDLAPAPAEPELEGGGPEERPASPAGKRANRPRNKGAGKRQGGKGSGKQGGGPRPQGAGKKGKSGQSGG